MLIFIFLVNMIIILKNVKEDFVYLNRTLTSLKYSMEWINFKTRFKCKYNFTILLKRIQDAIHIILICIYIHTNYIFGSDAMKLLFMVFTLIIM